jgi:TolB-like protein
MLSMAILGCSSARTGSPPPESSTSEQLLDARLEELTYEIVESLSRQEKSRIAVAEFSNLDGRTTQLGQYVAEELITRLFRTGRFHVVERHLLNRILDEHELNLLGLVDEASAKEIGKLLGVDAIACGSLTEIGERVKINARLISTETGQVFAVASASIPTDGTIRPLLTSVSAARSKVGGQDTGASGSVDTSAGAFFYEDFSDIEEGHIPAGWTGGHTLCVRSSPVKPGAKELAPFRDGSHHLFVAGVGFEDDWRFEVEFFLPRYPDWRKTPFTWTIGDLVVIVGKGTWGSSGESQYVKVDDSLTRMNLGATGQIKFLAIEQVGEVTKVFLDSKMIKMIRAKRRRPEGFSFECGADFSILSIRGAGV